MLASKRQRGHSNIPSTGRGLHEKQCASVAKTVRKFTPRRKKDIALDDMFIASQKHKRHGSSRKK
jgi:hypothetical protein